MELQDGAFPLISSIVATSDYKEAFDGHVLALYFPLASIVIGHILFTGVEIALLIGARPRSKGMERAELLQANAAIFKVEDSIILLSVASPESTYFACCCVAVWFAVSCCI